jgi:uncharacterized protein YutE (UPF0331/DUF86 family)
MKNKKYQVQITNIEISLNNIKIALKEKNYTTIVKTALATYLAQIYNGIESILENILKDKNIKIKKTDLWHKEVLLKIKELHIVGNKTIDKLQEYRGFRHIWRHGYAHILDEKNLIKLSKEIIDFYDTFKKDIFKEVSLEEVKRNSSIKKIGITKNDS